VTRRLHVVVVAVVALVVALAGVTVAAAADDTVGIGSISPTSGAAGTDISYTVVGSPNADSECRGSSAFATEFLAGNGVRLGTGSDTIAVPDGATPGQAYVRLVCYVSDETGRRVIRDVCASFEVSGGSAATPPPTSGATIDVPCPPAPRVIISHSVIRAQTAVGEAFNKILTGIGA